VTATGPAHRFERVDLPAYGLSIAPGSACRFACRSVPALRVHPDRRPAWLRRKRPFDHRASDQQHATSSRYHIRAAVRVLQPGASSLRRFIEDGLSSPSTTSEEAPFAVRATTCEDAPFVFCASLPVKSPNSLLRCGDSNRPRMSRGVLWSSAEPFVPQSPARAGCVIGSRGDHRRDRNIAIDLISYGTIQTNEFRRWRLSL